MASVHDHDTGDLRHRIEQAPMSAYQWLIIGICTFLNALDGYDVLAMAFTATPVTEEFGLSGSELGFLLSAGLLGMAVGSLTLGPVADRIGRRNMTLLAIVVNAAGLFLSATSANAAELGAWRIVTGLGIGGILVGTNVISSEYANRARRGLAVSIYAAGYGVGASLGGTAAVWMMDQFGWRSVYTLGGALTVVALVLVLFLLPESAAYLYNRRPAGALEKINRIARKIGQAPVAALPEVGPGTRAAGPSSDTAGEGDRGIGALFNGRHRKVTVLVWVSFFAVMFGFYFVNSWTPRLLNESGLTQNQGVVAGIMLTLGGTIGSLLFGVLTARWSTRSTLFWFTVGSAVAIVAFISSTAVVWAVFALGIVVGMLINGCIAGLYVLTPQAYPASMRSTGAGWAIGIGRAGAILAPLATGSLLDVGWTPQAVYIGVAAVVLIATVALGLLRGADIEANRAPQRQVR
ncbi:MFS transporter [Citricoccus sp. I39-566]|uniref:MFS transporter n=1 Tax=Citricoccus sp. I39-566 TaxID=3073268 RepID=UPI00286B31B2|nr:MFS transporter [Citricoccus sp. I39-566]WMY79535.1 MFS transporter [Citricoccus sp. I39-566]